MLAKTNSFALNGVKGYKIDIEIDINAGLPSYDMVGLPDTAIKESRERIRSAIKNSGYNYPVKRITINLAPADLKKEGPVFVVSEKLMTGRSDEQRMLLDMDSRKLYYRDMSGIKKSPTRYV